MNQIEEIQFTRKTLSIETGINLETIRFFEKIGLMPDPPRTEAGYRTYSHEHVRRLVFIKRAKGLGFSNIEVRALLDMADGDYSCNEVKAIAETNIDNISEKIADLENMRDTLSTWVDDCSGGDTPDCAIIDGLFK